MYAKRRAYYLENLQLDILKLKERIRFLDLIMAGALVVFKVPKAELVKKLEALKFKVFDDNDDSESADTTAKSLNRYNYLSRQAIDRFTDEQLDELKSELAKTEAEYNLLASKTPTALWKDELEILEKTLAATEKQRQDDKEETRKIEKGAINLPKNGAPKGVTKKRKA
jgi:small-conductance mechanosensitive channel